MENPRGSLSALDHIRAGAEEAMTTQALSSVRRKREAYLNDSECELEEYRKELFKILPDARIMQVSSWGITLESRPLKRVPNPPVGYCYKGGAARVALRNALGLPLQKCSARDIDLVRVSVASDAIDCQVALKIMKEDACHGHGVECISNFEEYLNTRDITINETLYLQGRVIASRRCIEDTMAGVFRPTPFALTQPSKDRANIAAKILRFAAEARLAGCVPKIVELPISSPLTFVPFLLHLDRALVQGTRLAEGYIRESITHGVLPTECKDSRSLPEILQILSVLPNSILPSHSLKRFATIAASLPKERGKSIGAKNRIGLPRKRPFF